MTDRARYAECPQCGSAAVAFPPASCGTRGRLRCRRCGFTAASFARLPFDPTRFDNRPRDAGGRVLPTCRDE